MIFDEWYFWHKRVFSRSWALFPKDDEEIINDFTDQPDLIRFMMIEISTEDDDGTSLDDETATQLFIVTSAMITLMGKAIKA